MRILLADDHQKVRSALELVLSLEPGVVLVGEVTSAQALTAALASASPDVLLLDWELPGLTEPETMFRTWRAQQPNLRIVVLSGWPGVQRMALLAGANAFVSKGEPPSKLLTTLRSWTMPAMWSDLTTA
jgi:DNA-binding NarL/FixJ family response regulator